jgi:hypothetical protein
VQLGQRSRSREYIVKVIIKKSKNKKRRKSAAFIACKMGNRKILLKLHPVVSSGHSRFLHHQNWEKNLDELDKWEFRGRIHIERCKKAGRKYVKYE